jgi:hypothetical protein
LNPRAPSESTRIPGVRLKLILSLAFSSRAFSYFHRASTAACQPPYGCQPVDRLTETGSRRQACHKALRKAIAREPALEVDELRKIDQARSEEMFLNLQPAIRKGTSSLPTSSPSRKRSRWRLWVLVKTKEPKIEWHVSERNPDDLVDYLKKAGYVAQEIKAGRFFKRPGLWCTWCALIVAIGLIPSGIGITPGAQAQPRRIAHG